MKNTNYLILSGIIGLIAAIVVGAGEFLLHFDALNRFGSEQEYEFMLGISNTRFTAGHFLGVLGVPFYIIGCWHIYLMLKPANKLLAFIGFLLASYGLVMGGVWMGSRASIGSLMQLTDAGAQVQQLIELYKVRYENLLTITRITTLLLSVIIVWLALTGKSHYPRWMAALNPIFLIVLSFVVYAVVPALGIYIMPIALNVAFFIFFAASIWHARKV